MKNLKQILLCLEQRYKGSDELTERDRNSEFDRAALERKRILEIKRKRNARKRKFFAFLFLLLLILSAGFIFINTPLFDISDIKIKGNAIVADEDILSSCGIDIGDNIFSHTASYYEEKIISLPYVSSVTVKKKYPSEVTITVKEEKEFVAVYSEGTYITCDKNGKSIDELTEKPEELIIVEELIPGKFTLGEMFVADADEGTVLFRDVISCVMEYSFENVTKIDLSDYGNVVFIVNDSLTIKLGKLETGDDMAYKMAYVKEVMDNLPKNISGIIDATNTKNGVSFRSGEFEHSIAGEETEETTGSESTEEVASEGGEMPLDSEEVTEESADNPEGGDE